MNNSYESIKHVLISVLRFTYNLIKFIAKAICSIIVFRPDPTCNEGQIYYMHGTIFFSKQFKKSDHQRIQNKCRKNWNQYLRWVSDARMFKRINW